MERERKKREKREREIEKKEDVRLREKKMTRNSLLSFLFGFISFNTTSN